MPDTHKITKASVGMLERGVWGIDCEFDDRSRLRSEVGPKATAEWYAREQLGEELPVGVNPLLLGPKKAQKLRQRS